MERSTTAVAAWLRVLLLAAPLHASLIAPSVQLQGGAPARSAAATQRRGAGLHTICMRAIGVDSEASLDGLDSLDEDSHVRLTGDPAADAMIRRKMGIPAPKSSKSKLVAKKLRREDMVEAKGHRVGERMSGGRRASEVATGLNTREWKAEVDAVRSSSVTAVRVRHMLVQTEELAELLLGQLREGAEFEVRRLPADADLHPAPRPDPRPHHPRHHRHQAPSPLPQPPPPPPPPPPSPYLFTLHPDQALAKVASTCATGEEGGHIGWAGLEDEHLDETLPREARAVALAMRPGDVKAVPSSLGVHVLRVDDVFQTLNIDSQPRTRPLPGSGHRPQPLIELLRQGSEDGRSLLQLAAAGSTEAGQGTGAAGELMLNSGKTAGTTMRYSMESMGCQMNTADAERMEGQLQALGLRG